MNVTIMRNVERAQVARDLLPHLAGALSRTLARREDPHHILRVLALCGRYLAEGGR